jgi:MYXO-CTERM domain-containing protein
VNAPAPAATPLPNATVIEDDGCSVGPSHDSPLALLIAPFALLLARRRSHGFKELKERK